MDETEAADLLPADEANSAELKAGPAVQAST